MHVHVAICLPLACLPFRTDSQPGVLPSIRPCILAKYSSATAQEAEVPQTKIRDATIGDNMTRLEEDKRMREVSLRQNLEEVSKLHIMRRGA
jgi:hypothetical protein